mmetsp:Transcript_29051/g.33467  ORF Transcript_29051/g.33467 Transcript_29051/m.33467 type:complete len:231 (+) Transcript_29051:318-1010(+)
MLVQFVVFTKKIQPLTFPPCRSAWYTNSGNDAKSRRSSMKLGKPQSKNADDAFIYSSHLVAPSFSNESNFSLERLSLLHLLSALPPGNPSSTVSPSSNTTWYAGTHCANLRSCCSDVDPQSVKSFSYSSLRRSNDGPRSCRKVPFPFITRSNDPHRPPAISSEFFSKRRTSTTESSSFLLSFDFDLDDDAAMRDATASPPTPPPTITTRFFPSILLTVRNAFKGVTTEHR